MPEGGVEEGKLRDRSLEKEWGTLGLASPLMNSVWPRTRYSDELAGLSPLGEASNRRMADFFLRLKNKFS